MLTDKSFIKNQKGKSIASGGGVETEGGKGGRRSDARGVTLL